MGKLRAEYFWTDRWLSSSAVMLSLECRGLYREMLTLAWTQDASLPNDPDQIKQAVRATDPEWKRCWPIIRRRYWRVEDGRLVNDTQREVYAQSTLRYQHASARARKRWDKARTATADDMQRVHLQDVQMQPLQMQARGSRTGTGTGTGTRKPELSPAVSTQTRARRKRTKAGTPVEKSKRSAR